jgi:hypothetical protein
LFGRIASARVAIDHNSTWALVSMEMKQYLKKTPGGLILRNCIRRLTPDLFTSANDHNPYIARHCEKCGGKGFYRNPRRDKQCEDCGGLGGYEEKVPFFVTTGPTCDVSPNAAGSLICPACGRNFPVTSNQYWSGLRHACGQKLRLTGPNANLCWRKTYDNENGAYSSESGPSAPSDQFNRAENHGRKPWWKIW